MVAGRVRLSIVITDERGHHRAAPAFQTWNISIQREIFAVLVVPAVADHVPSVVEERSRFQEHARFRGQMMNRLQLIKKLDAQLAHVFGMPLIIFKSAGEATRADE